jgi:hypothetical protein
VADGQAGHAKVHVQGLRFRNSAYGLDDVETAKCLHFLTTTSHPSACFKIELVRRQRSGRKEPVFVFSRKNKWKC